MFGKSDFGKNLGSAKFSGYLAIALGLLVSDVDADFERMQPGLVRWCEKNGFTRG